VPSTGPRPTRNCCGSKPSRPANSPGTNARLARKDVAAEVAELKNQPGVGGAGLAASLAEKDLIDEYRLFICPVVLGGGTPFFPPLAKRLGLELIETQTFSQVVYLRYRRG
jgi:dihydrofolate reductase